MIKIYIMMYIYLMKNIIIICLSQLLYIHILYTFINVYYYNLLWNIVLEKKIHNMLFLFLMLLFNFIDFIYYVHVHPLHIVLWIYTTIILGGKGDLAFDIVRVYRAIYGDWLLISYYNFITLSFHPIKMSPRTFL